MPSSCAGTKTISFEQRALFLAFNFSVGLSSHERLSPLFYTLRSEKPFQNLARQTEAHCLSSTNREHQTEQPWGTVVVNFYANTSLKQRLSSSVFSAFTKIKRTCTATLWVGLRLLSRKKNIILTVLSLEIIRQIYRPQEAGIF